MGSTVSHNLVPNCLNQVFVPNLGDWWDLRTGGAAAGSCRCWKASSIIQEQIEGVQRLLLRTPRNLAFS